MLSLNMTYVVAGAAAVALVILVLVLVVVRGRKARVPAGLDAGPEWAPQAGAAVAGAGETAVAIESVAPPAEATAEVEPASPMDLIPGMDPAVTLVTSLIQHSGELDPEELRRLELYRPQRIVAAVEALTPRMTGRGNESKRSRLVRIRQYADSLMAEPIGEPVATDVTVSTDPPPVQPPEAWGSAIEGTRLTLDPELSVLDEQPAPTPESAPTPATEDATEDTAEDRSAGHTPDDSDDDDKRAAIDTLARLATPEALSKLQRYLDDPDPEIQLYALSAAERLLGPG